MGVNTWAAFAGADDNAVVDGDFAMHENELQTVLKAMRKGGINNVAIHHHMSDEKPKFLFLHYWGRVVRPRSWRARCVARWTRNAGWAKRRWVTVANLACAAAHCGPAR